MSGHRGASWRVGAAATLLLAVPAAAAADTAVALRARPASLVLGGEARAVLEIDTGGGDPPWVTASVGRIENLRPLGGGRFEADYLPPAEAYPQVAIVAAVAGDRCGFTAIPLSGRGVATARSAPGVSVRVTIGDVAFGPVRADWSGEARVPVIAPPGIRYAFHRDRPLDLKIPATVHVHVATAQAAAPADADQELRLCIFAVTTSGAPRAGAPVALEVTQGTIVDRAEGAPGEIVARWRLPAGAARAATATVSLSDEPGPASALTVARPAGAPVRLAIDASPSRVLAGEAATVALRVRVADAAGNAVALAPRLETDLGDVSAPVAAGDAWEARLRIPAAIGARPRVELVARAAAVEERVGIDVIPAPVATPAAPLVVAPAAPPERRLSVAPKVGLAASAGGLRAADLSAEAAYRPALLAGRLELVLEAGAFFRDRTDDVAAGDGRVQIRGRVRYVPITTSARWQLALGARQLAWASAGAGMALVSSQVTVGDTIRNEAGLVAVTETAAGWGLRAGRATPFVEARLARHADPGLETLRGSLMVLTLSVGCRYDAY